MVYIMRSPIRIRLEPGQCSDRHFDGSRFAATNNHQLLTAVDLKVQTIDGIQGFVLLQGAFQRWEVTEKCKAIGSNLKDPKVSNQKKGTASFGPAPFSQFSGPVAAWDWLHLLFVGSNHHCPFRQGTCSNASSVGQIYSKVLIHPSRDIWKLDKVGDCDAALKNFTCKCLPFDQKTCGKVVFACPHWCSVFSYRKLP